MCKILIPIPDVDFDPTEVSVPWSHLRDAGHEILFATPSGEPGQADFRMVSGEGLGPLAPMLMARKPDLLLYEELRKDSSFLHPLRYGDIRSATVDGIVLPGGHAKGMRAYLESGILHATVAAFFADGKPVAAICHGVLLAARSRDPRTGKSVLSGKRTTALLRSQELLAWNLTRLWLGDYYRTYPTTVQDEVESLLATPGDFVSGPIPLSRDSFHRPDKGFVLRDGNYLSARWSGDAHRFATEVGKLVSGSA